MVFLHGYVLQVTLALEAAASPTTASTHRAAATARVRTVPLATRVRATPATRAPRATHATLATCALAASASGTTATARRAVTMETA